MAATESTAFPFPERSMRLLDPDGVVVASSDHADLTYPVTLATLDKSRDADGHPRMWWLEVLPEDDEDTEEAGMFTVNLNAFPQPGSVALEGEA